MKPRTKLQVEVVQLSNRLLPINQEQKQWAYKECLPHKGFANKQSAFCLDCGETFSLVLIKRKQAVCPHCKTKLSIEQTRKTTDQQTNYFAIAEVFGEFQIIRNYELIAHYKRGIPAKYFLHEILQDWILPNGKVTKYGLRHINNWGTDRWTGLMEIRLNPTNYWNNGKYDVYARKYHPDSIFKPEYSKIGITYNFSGLTFLEAIKFISNNPKAETLVKLGEYALLVQVFQDEYKINRFWPSIKISLRNKYKIKDVTIWLDYLDLLHYFKKDLHNAKYVCPKNLMKEHDRLMKKKRVILEAQDRKRKKQEAIERQKKLERAKIDYFERIKKFFELEFVKDNISISVLKDIDEFKIEGEFLNHCVFTNEYYLKDNSLLFSAKVAGVRTETIEIRLSDFKIEQARGKNNNSSPYHNQIVALVKKNIPKIRKIVKQSKNQSLKLTA